MSDPVIRFYPYQRDWLQDRARFKIGMFSRQTGKTFTTGAEAVDDCLRAEIEGRRARWVILSRGERQAAEAIQEGITLVTRGFYAAYGELARAPRPEIGPIEDAAGGVLDAEYKRLEVRFPGGSRITALPANPDTARGFSANVILDEFAFHRDSRAIWGALFPVISRGGLKLRVISTPNGKSNKFYELMTGSGDAWSRHIVDIYKAVQLGCPRDIEELRAGMADDELWAQEYELQWLDAASAWLPFDLIARAEDPGAGDPAGYLGGPCYLGVDIAARADLFVIWVMEEVGDVLWTREIVTRKGISFAEQDALLADVFVRYRVVRAAMDQTGMGEKPVEDARRRHGDDRVEGMLFSPARKLDMAIHLKERLEDRRLRIPQGDPRLRADLHSVRRETGRAGMVRLAADRDAAGHADRFWAGALAATAAHSDYQPAAYDAVPGAGSRLNRAAHAGDEDDDMATAGRFGSAEGAW